jgi:two-component system, OmpR family, sensor kinase
MTRRLIWTLTAALGGLWLVAAAASALVAYAEIGAVYDGALLQTAQRLLPLVLDDLDELTGAEPPESDASPGDDDAGEEDWQDDDYLLYQVRGPDGRVLLRSPDAPRRAFAAPLVRGFFTGDRFRIYTLPAADAGVVVQVAQPLGQRLHAVLEGLAWQLAPLLGLIPLSAAVIWWTVYRMRRTLGAVQAAIRDRGGSNLAALPAAGLPDELAPIVADVNRLLERLQAALEGERAFAANSAHELRTPIAAALAQAQRLAAQLDGTPEEARAQAIVATLGRLGGLAGKLLQLARAEAGVGLAAEPVDLLPMVRLLVDDGNRRRDAAGRIALDTGGLAEFVVKADLDAAGIALQNLLDNALAHGPAGAPVTVTLAPDGSIRVISAGPPVPAETLPRLARRFERASAAGPGAGLGLAIVDALMRQSGGTLTLRSPATGRADGFEAVLGFVLR